MKTNSLKNHNIIVFTSNLETRLRSRSWHLYMQVYSIDAYLVARSLIWNWKYSSKDLLHRHELLISSDNRLMLKFTVIYRMNKISQDKFHVCYRVVTKIAILNLMINIKNWNYIVVSSWDICVCACVQCLCLMVRFWFDNKLRFFNLLLFITTKL